MAVKVCESDRRFDLKKAAHGHKLSGLFLFRLYQRKHENNNTNKYLCIGWKDIPRYGRYLTCTLKPLSTCTLSRGPLRSFQM